MAEEKCSTDSSSFLDGFPKVCGSTWSFFTTESELYLSCRRGKCFLKFHLIDYFAKIALVSRLKTSRQLFNVTNNQKNKLFLKKKKKITHCQHDPGVSAWLCQSDAVFLQWVKKCCCDSVRLRSVAKERGWHPGRPGAGVAAGRGNPGQEGGDQGGGANERVSGEPSLLSTYLPYLCCCCCWCWQLLLLLWVFVCHLWHEPQQRWQPLPEVHWWLLPQGFRSCDLHHGHEFFFLYINKKEALLVFLAKTARCNFLADACQLSGGSSFWRLMDSKSICTLCHCGSFHLV